MGIKNFSFAVTIDDFSNHAESQPGLMDRPRPVTIANPFENTGGSEIRGALTNKYSFDTANNKLNYNHTQSGPSAITYTFQNNYDFTNFKIKP